MAKNPNKKYLMWAIAGVVVLGIAFLGYKYYKARQFRLPKGFAYGNGRIEAKLVDVASKEALRVKKLLADEGDIVEPSEIVVQMDTITLQAELAESKATVAAKQESEAIAKAGIVKAESEVELAKIEIERARKLVEEKAGSQRDYDVRKTTVQTTAAGLAEQQARLQTARQEVLVAQANVATIQTRIDDATLRSPVRGRVLYRLAEEGEVLSPGGKALTLINLQDVYMEIFLPSEQAAKLKIGAEARIKLDHSGRSVAGSVSFVSPEAQFTPKQVETRSEREKLMFRVKIKVPEELVTYYLEYVKTGIRGVGYVKIDESAVWPGWLQNLVSPPKTPGDKQPFESAASNF
ncbi:MAG: hypothetical protein A2Y07_04495 [Planctomycetes bacterium GWF2_50_10]|nr:MAG: hypothetical protein A2Y07_04495 [Planctomycetes bacterium GWF2_50_10]